MSDNINLQPRRYHGGQPVHNTDVPTHNSPTVSELRARLEQHAHTNNAPDPVFHSDYAESPHEQPRTTPATEPQISIPLAAYEALLTRLARLEAPTSSQSTPEATQPPFQPPTVPLARDPSRILDAMMKGVKPFTGTGGGQQGGQFHCGMGCCVG